MSDYRSPRQERTDRLVDRLIAERAPAAAEGTDELRDAGLDYLDRLASTSDNPILLRAVAGVLLAKLAAVEALAEHLDTYAGGRHHAAAVAIREALNGESRG